VCVCVCAGIVNDSRRANRSSGGGGRSQASLTLAFSMTLENSPSQTTQRSGVTSRKQSPPFSDDALGSTSRV